MNSYKQNIKIRLFYTFLLLISGLVFGIQTAPHAHAGSTISVNSSADNTTAGDAGCTLREAIINANSNSDTTTGDCVAGIDATDIIHFNISGVADFTSGGQNGYTITLASHLPFITDSVTIDGHSQPGSQYNTAVSPAPMDSILLIEIDGTNLTAGANDDMNQSCLGILGATNVFIYNLVINNCGNNGINIQNSSNTTVQGNYIGVDPDGVTKQANGYKALDATGLGVFALNVDYTLIGGTNPKERNVIAGNNYGDILVDSLYTGADINLAPTNTYTTIQGNYISVGADGTTILPPGSSLGAGNSILMTHSAHDIIGGAATGAMNIIAASNEYGISFRNGSFDGLIEGNYIGTDYTGNVPALHPDGTPDCDPNILNPCGSSGHPWGGISIATISVAFQLPPHDFIIRGNVSGGNAAWNGTGSQGAPGMGIHDASYNVTIVGNSIGLGADGISDIGNQSDGITISNADVNPPSNVHDILVGGTTAQDANTIVNNGNKGIGISSDDTVATILRNVIYNNADIGIDLARDGVTPNNHPPVTTGPNTSLNYPEYLSTVEDAGDTTVYYQLDVPAGNYRIEFYSNTVQDPSGQGEGEEYLGFANVTSTGSGPQDLSHVLAGVTGITNLAMTATLIDGGATYGFGPTSEFGGLLVIPDETDTAVTKTLVNPQDVAQGANIDYQITVTNTTHTPLDLTQYDGSLFPNAFTSNLIIDFLPPGLTYASNTNPDITCSDVGTALTTALAANHTDWSTVFCYYTGAGQTLGMGQSITDTITVTIANDSDLVFTNYVIGGFNNLDPDTTNMNNALGDAFGTNGALDLIDAIITNNPNNFAKAEFPIPVNIPQPEITNPTDTTLASTGSQLPLKAVACCILTSAFLFFVIYRKAISIDSVA